MTGPQRLRRTRRPRAWLSGPTSSTCPSLASTGLPGDRVSTMQPGGLWPTLTAFVNRRHRDGRGGPRTEPADAAAPPLVANGARIETSQRLAEGGHGNEGSACSASRYILNETSLEPGLLLRSMTFTVPFYKPKLDSKTPRVDADMTPQVGYGRLCYKHKRLTLAYTTGHERSYASLCNNTDASTPSTFRYSRRPSLLCNPHLTACTRWGQPSAPASPERQTRPPSAP